EYHDYGLIFAQPDGRPLSPRTIYDEFKRLLSRAKLPPIRFHDLRHTHASLMLAQGVNLKVVSERLGHSTVAITGDIYSHVLPTLQEQAAAVLETALFGPPKAAETTPEKPPKTQGS
ncbi:MAG TPA: site-specific integrase, partial [Firmicutes bacterium]|nr:site-specific integrase [Bacillota bacterium]